MSNFESNAAWYWLCNSFNCKLTMGSCKLVQSFHFSHRDNLRVCVFCFQMHACVRTYVVCIRARVSLFQCEWGTYLLFSSAVLIFRVQPCARFNETRLLCFLACYFPWQGQVSWLQILAISHSKSSELSSRPPHSTVLRFFNCFLLNLSFWNASVWKVAFSTEQNIYVCTRALFMRVCVCK